MEKFVLASWRPARKLGLHLCYLSLCSLSGCLYVPEPSFDPEAAAVARANLGLCYLDAGQIEAAGQHLGRAAGFNGACPRVQAALGRYYWERGEYRRAERYYRQVLSVGCEEAEKSGGFLSDTYAEYGEFLLARQRYPEAALVCVRALAGSDTPNLLKKLALAAYVLFLNGELESSQEHLVRLWNGCRCEGSRFMRIATQQGVYYRDAGAYQFLQGQANRLKQS